MRFSKKKMAAKLSAFALTAAVTATTAFSGFVPFQNQAGEVVYAAERTDYGLAQSSQQGVILHCWNWSYNNIKKYMKDIAAAGYTTIQTSPVQQPKDYYWEGVAYGNVGIPNGTGGEDGNWWKLYQPVTFSICDNGYTWLGNKAEFTAMCAEAEKYGVKVIVDIVANHMGNIQGYKIGDEETVMGDISPQVGEFWKPEMLTDTSYWHISTSWTHTSDGRFDVTQGNMGMPDLNTGDAKVQKMVLDLLKECIDCGADGFRFDAAKHIETPVDNAKFASNFWDVVLDGARSYYKQKNGTDGIYFYGEVLNRLDDSNVEKYLRSKMSITDNSTSDNLRNSVINGSVSALATSGYCGYIGGQGTKAVLWPESHDTYMGGGSSYDASDADIKRTWAIIASRKDSTGLFFARPYYSRDILAGDQSKARQSTKKILENIEQTQIGDVGSITWADKSVVAVNRFRNFFVGQSEKLGASGNTAYNMRGNTGIVIVRGEGQGPVSLHVGMKDGTYTDQVTGEKFTVSGGTIKGNVKGEDCIAVVYNPTVDYGEVHPEEPVVVKINASLSTETSTFTTNTADVTMTVSDGTTGEYTTTEGAKGTFTGTKTITVGKLTGTGENVAVSIKATAQDGTSKTKVFTYKKTNASAAYPTLSSGGVVFDNTNYKWAEVYCYVYSADESVKNSGWPGVKMDIADGNFYTYELPETLTGKVHVIFSNGSGAQYPSGAGLAMTATDKKLFQSPAEGFVELPESKGVLTATLTPSATEVVSGQSVTLNTKTENAEGAVKYTYTSADGQIISANGKTATWKAPAKGTYKIAVNVKDGNTEVTAVTTIKVTDNVTPKKLSVNLTADKSSVTPTGTATLTAVAAGGSGNYKYTYSISADGKTAVLASESTSSSYKWTAGNVAGTKTLTVTVTDAAGATASSSVVMNVENKTPNLAVKLTANKNTVSPKGMATLTATASGGTEKYKYTYSITANGKTVVMAKDIVSNKYDWVAGMATGAKTLTVTVTDATGATASSSVIMNVENKTPNLAVKLTANKNTVSPKGMATLTATATGGTGKCKYTYSITANGKTVVMAKDIVPNKYDWVAGMATGAKTLTVNVTDATGATASSSIILNVQNSQAELGVKLRAATISPKARVTDTLTASATGGAGNYRYTFVIRNNNTGAAAVLTSSQVSNIYKWNSGPAGSKTLIVIVSDSKGATASSSMTIVVK